MEESPGYVRPSQWRDMHTGANGDDAPIHRLMLAMLEDALRCATGARSPRARYWKRKFKATAAQREFAATKRSRRANHLAREAIGWINDCDAVGVFSFQNVCETLGVDAAKLRARVRELLVGEKRAA